MSNVENDLPYIDSLSLIDPKMSFKIPVNDTASDGQGLKTHGQLGSLFLLKNTKKTPKHEME